MEFIYYFNICLVDAYYVFSTILEYSSQHNGHSLLRFIMQVLGIYI